VLWIRIRFNADPGPDPAFYLNVDPDADQDPESQPRRIHADPDVQALKSQNV
jgi:hypothetical protein